jgi:SAC3 family protein LENG8/THP3
VNIKFLTEELGFESHEDTYKFIVDHCEDTVLQEAGDSLLFKTAEAFPIIDIARANAFKSIDIKGQI